VLKILQAIRAIETKRDNRNPLTAQSPRKPGKSSQNPAAGDSALLVRKGKPSIGGRAFDYTDVLDGGFGMYTCRKAFSTDASRIINS